VAGEHRSDRGSASTEFVLIMPALIAFLFLLLAAGRLTDAKSDIVGAASDAARAASVQPTAGQANAAAAAAADDTVSGERLNCSGGGPQVDADYEPVFQRGAIVHITVTCTVNVSDLSYIGFGPSVTLTEEAWEPIDAHRSQAP
jgi:Flp pilus assembly protein TadG